MSIRKDVTVKITNNNATLDMPLQIYELDHGIELRFKLMDYKYKYTKDPQNILNSSDEDILEAYTTIINPRGYELQQINGEVKDDIVIFMIDSSYTDEIDEIGTYSLQIHIKCACSEFSIPPIQFEVLQRLKGIKVVTDGEDSIDDSALIDNYSNFISDETGKLLIEWKKGDIISSVKLNAMVEVINNAVDEEVQRQLNEVKREQQELERQNKVREALNSVDVRVDEAMIEYETRFNALTVSQQQDMEVIDARDGEVSLKARLDRDVRNPLQVYEDVEGSCISCDSIEGYAQNVEILGNTIQKQDNLADIRSVGDKLENQELYKIPVLSCGKNLFDKSNANIGYVIAKNTGETVVDTNNGNSSSDYIRINADKKYSYNKRDSSGCAIYDLNKNFVQYPILNDTGLTNHSFGVDGYIRLNIGKDVLDTFQLEEGAVTTSYEPYQGHKLTILSPVQLEKVGDVADRIVCKDGVWGVEKNIGTIIIDGNNNFGYHLASSQPSDSSLINIYISKVLTKANTLSTLICDRFVNNSDIKAGNCYAGGSGNIHFVLNKSDFESTTSFKEWLQKNNVLVKYQLATPQFIPLPHDQQVKLRTFANKTNISFLTEIEGTIKAQVPKSIGATVNTHTEQIRSLNNELNRVKKLEESTVSTVTTESDFTTVEETANGYFEDVKLEGKTLVNLFSVSFFNASSDRLYSNYTSIHTQNLTTGKLITAFNFSSRIVYLDVYNDTTWVKVVIIEPYKSVLVQLNGTEHIPRYLGLFADGWEDTEVFRQELGKTCFILEGDHTQNPPSFFEGLMSVGQDVDEISVLSCNENLFVNDVVGETGIGNNANGTLYPTMYAPSAFRCRSANLIKVKPNTDYYFSSKHKFWFAIAEFDSENRQILENGWTIHSSGVHRTSPNCENIIVLIKKDDNLTITPSEVYNGNIQIKEGSVKTEYTPYQSDKKRILYYNDETQTWEKPVLREWDSIEKHLDGKYYYHKRSGEVVLNGSEEWRIRPDVTDDGVHVIFTVFTSFKYNKSSYMICDKFNPKSVAGASEAYSKGEGITYYNYSSSSDYAIYYVISKSKLSSQDVAGFTAWLQANPATIVYQLETEEVYECTSIDLLTYKNETNFIVNAGAIAPVSTLKVMCNINNVVRELQQKVSNLENYIQHVMIDALNNALNE